MIQIRGLIAPALAIVASLLGASTASAQAPLCYTLESLQGSYGTVSYFGDNIALGLASRYHDANGNFATAFVVNQPAAGSTTGVRNLVTGTNKGSDTVNCDGSGVVSRTLTLSDGTTSQAFDDLLITEGTVQNGKLIATAVTDMQRIPSTIVPGGVFIIRKYTRRPDTRTAGCYTLASLQGSYGVQVYYGANVALGLQAEILDGKGNLTRTGLLNQPTAGSTTGARTIGPVTSTGTYTVNCDGSGTISRIVTRPDGTTATALDDFLVTAGTEKDGQLTATTIFDAQRDPSVILPGGVFVFRSHTLRPAQGTGPARSAPPGYRPPAR